MIPTDIRYPSVSVEAAQLLLPSEQVLKVKRLQKSRLFPMNQTALGAQAILVDGVCFAINLRLIKNLAWFKKGHFQVTLCNESR